MQEKGRTTVAMSKIHQGVAMAMDPNYPVKSPAEMKKILLEVVFQEYGDSPLWPLIYKSLNDQFQQELLESKKDDKRLINRP